MKNGNSNQNNVVPGFVWQIFQNEEENENFNHYPIFTQSAKINKKGLAGKFRKSFFIRYKLVGAR